MTFPERWALPAESLSIYRIVYAGWLLLFAMRPLSWLADVPASFFAPPPGPMRVFPGFPSTSVAIGMEVALAAAALCLLLGYRTRVASLVTGLLLVTGYGFIYSMGKIDHGSLLFNLVPLFMAFSTWGARYSMDARRGAGGGDGAWPVASFALVTGFAMFTAALPKTLTGWLSPTNLAARGHFLRRFATDEAGPLGDLAWRADVPALWAAADYLTIGLEAGLLAAVVWPAMFRAKLALLVLFHLSVSLVMGIGFTNAIVAYGVFVSWGALQKDLPRPMTRWALALPAWMIAIAVPVYYLVFTRFGAPLSGVRSIAIYMVSAVIAASLVRSIYRPASADRSAEAPLGSNR